MKKFFAIVALLFAVESHAAIKAFIVIQQINVSGGNLNLMVEIQPVTGSFLTTSFSVPATTLDGSSIIAGVKKLVIAYAASPPISQVWLPQEIWVLTGGRDQNNTITLNGLTIATWTNMPAAITRLGQSIVAFDLTFAQQIRFVINVVVAGVAGARVGAQYSLDGSTNWRFFDGASGPNVLIDTTGPKQSAWIDLELAAKGPVFISVGGQGGNGTVDPQFGLTFLEVR